MGVSQLASYITLIMMEHVSGMGYTQGYLPYEMDQLPSKIVGYNKQMSQMSQWVFYPRVYVRASVHLAR